MAKTQAVSFSRTGGPEVLEYVDIDLPPPAQAKCRSSMQPSALTS